MELKWRAAEYEHHEKGASWFWLVIIATVLAVAFAVWRGNFLFAVFSVVAATLLIAWGRRAPREIEFALNKEGLEIVGYKFYPYGDFQGYAVKGDELILQRKSRLSPYLKVRLPERGEERIKLVLSRALSEIEYEESLIDSIAKIIRF